MIKSLSLKKFKQFASLKLDGMKRITLIGGKNNTGKTSLLEALYIFHDRFNPDVILKLFAWRGISSVNLSPDSLWSPIFISHDMSTPIEMEILKGETRERLTIEHYPTVKKRISSISESGGMSHRIQTKQKAFPSEALAFTYYQNDKETGKSYLSINGKDLDIHIDELPYDSPKATFVASGAQRSPVEDATRFGKLDMRGSTKGIFNALKIVEPELTSLSTISHGAYALIHGDTGLSRKTPIAFMGEGTSKLFSILLAIATSEDGVVLIDEIENGWHYSLFPKIWSAIAAMAKEVNCQVIATTHAYDVLKSLGKGLGEEYKENAAYIRLDRLDGATIPKMYSAEMLSAALEREWEVR